MIEPTDTELDELQQTNSGAADLRDTLINIAREIEALKRECGMDPESPIAIQNGRYMALSYKVRALAAGQATAARVVASSAVMSAIRDANMQLVRTGDDAFILAPYKSADAAPVQPAAGPANDDAMPAAPQPNTACAELPIDELRTNYLDLLQEVMDAKDVMLAAGCPQDSFGAMFAEYSASHGQAPAQAAPAYKDSTPELHIGDSAFESWYSSYNPTHKGDKQRARDAYAAGMWDPLVMAAPAAVAGPSDAEPLHITHGPLMRHAAYLLCSSKPALPEHESVAAELELAADGHPTPSGEPSKEWLEVVRLAAAPTTQPAPQQEAQEPVAWAPGANLFKDWCAQWFGPDSDDGYLAKAVFDLPPMAQVFKRAAPQPSPASQGYALDAALDAFEHKERGIPQAHIAAALVAELRAAIEAASTTPTAQGDALEAAKHCLEMNDPLQGAANWLVTAHSALETSTLAGKLSIGYNRAKRLHDAALAAQGGTKA